jgi:hypothetical protein
MLGKFVQDIEDKYLHFWLASVGPHEGLGAVQ